MYCLQWHAISLQSVLLYNSAKPCKLSCCCLLSGCRCNLIIAQRTPTRPTARISSNNCANKNKLNFNLRVAKRVESRLCHKLPQVAARCQLRVCCAVVWRLPEWKGRHLCRERNTVGEERRDAIKLACCDLCKSFQLPFIIVVFVFLFVFHCRFPAFHLTLLLFAANWSEMQIYSKC